MPSRRSLILGALAAGISPQTGWAGAGSPAFVSAARKPDGAYGLFGLLGNDGRDRLRSVPLPGRGHAAAAHPENAVAVAFARQTRALSR